MIDTLKGCVRTYIYVLYMVKMNFNLFDTSFIMYISWEKDSKLFLFYFTEDITEWHEVLSHQLINVSLYFFLKRFIVLTAGLAWGLEYSKSVAFSLKKKLVCNDDLAGDVFE